MSRPLCISDWHLHLITGPVVHGWAELGTQGGAEHPFWRRAVTKGSLGVTGGQGQRLPRGQAAARRKALVGGPGPGTALLVQQRLLHHTPQA